MFQDYSDEYDDYDGGFYGSPSSASPTVAQYLYNRGEKPSQSRNPLGSYIKDEEGDSAIIEDSLQLILEVLPNISDERATEVLRSNNYDVEKTINFLVTETPKSPIKEDTEVFQMEFEQVEKKEQKVENELPQPNLEGKIEKLSIMEGKSFTPIKIKKPAYLKESKEEDKTDKPATPKSVKQMSASRRSDIEKSIKAVSREKEHINLVVIGHVDAGKSTLMGHLLYLLGVVSKKVMHKYEKDSKSIGKGAFSYAWVLDEHEEERTRGITMDVGIQNFETDHRKVTLLDAPGHRDFVPNMITGTAQADVAILVVDAGLDQFEKGFESDGQTKEHALLARSLGVQQLGIVVNKLDSVDWSKERFDSIVKKLTIFLKQSGFREKSLWFLPASGLSGENLVERKVKGLEWYSGPTLVQRIDEFEPPERDIAKPFRFCISDIYKGQNVGIAVGGKIELGFVTTGDKLLLLPLNEICTVKTIRLFNNPVEYAVAGDNVDLGLTGIEIQNISIGNVLCDPESPPSLTNKFKAQIITFAIQRPIIIGHTVEFHYQNMNEVANVTQLLAILDKSTGEIKKKKPRSIGDQMTATVQITTQHPICIELYSNCKPLGRFTLREGGKTIAAGIVTEIM